MITEFMVCELNYILEEEGTCFRLDWRNNGLLSVVDIVLKSDKYLNTSINQLVYPNKDFYNRLESLFKQRYDLTGISYNNTRTTFWCSK